MAKHTIARIKGYRVTVLGIARLLVRLLSLAVLVTLLTGLTTQGVNQPSRVPACDRLSVQVSIPLAAQQSPQRGVLGVHLPPGWAVVNATLSGAMTGPLVPDVNVVKRLEEQSATLPAKSGYTWWGGATEGFFVIPPESAAVALVDLASGPNLGSYLLDYAAGTKDSVNTISIQTNFRDVPISVFTATPLMPQIVSPSNGAQLTALTTTVSWQNPPDATQYHLELRPFNDDGPGISLIRNLESSFTFNPPLLGEGNYVMLPGMTYTWRVRSTKKAVFAPNNDPCWGPWVESIFRTPPPNSATISPVAPHDGTTTVPPFLQWDNTSKNIFYYEVQVSADPTFNTDPATATSFVWHNLVHGGATNPLNSFSLPLLPRNKTIYWRVRPRVQGDGTPVQWSQTWRFFTY